MSLEFRQKGQLATRYLEQLWTRFYYESFGKLCRIDRCEITSSKDISTLNRARFNKDYCLLFKCPCL